ncbi:MAG: protein-glutamate O-methyltransferase CheR [Thermoleophilia bacterium]
MSVPVRDEYVDFCEGIRRLTQIDLLQYKRGQMERRIRSFADRRGIKGLSDYLKALQASGEELDEFLDRVTINVSQLWRNPEQWRFLEKDIIPELAKTGKVRCWSAGSSYGAEAYTLAATCVETAPNARVEVLGTDIDKRVVERARRGRFSAEDARTAPQDKLKRWFVEDDGVWEAKPELKRAVRFETGDLLRNTFPKEAYDLVLCRNVVIYFTEPVRDELHARLAASVRPGGYLMIGSTERVSSPRDLGLEPSHPFTYRKR